MRAELQSFYTKTLQLTFLPQGLVHFMGHKYTTKTVHIAMNKQSHLLRNGSLCILIFIQPRNVCTYILGRISIKNKQNNSKFQFLPELVTVYFNHFSAFYASAFPCKKFFKNTNSSFTHNKIMGQTTTNRNISNN